MSIILSGGDSVTITGPIEIEDGGGSITVDGPLTDNELRATPVSVLGTLENGTTSASTVPYGVGTMFINASTLNWQAPFVRNTVPGTFDMAQVTRQVGMPAAAALVDNTANPTLTQIQTFPMIWDGGTWDRLAGTAADGVLVNLGTNNDVTVTGTVTANAGTGTFATKETRSSSPSQSSVNDSASNVTLLASNANRLGATVFNDSSEALYLKLGATASTTSFTCKIPAGGYYEVPFNYTGIIDGIWNADSTGAARITELT